MPNHITNVLVLNEYIHYQILRSKILKKYSNGEITTKEKNNELAQIMYDAMMVMGVDAFISYNTREATDDNMYQGVSL